MKVMTTRLLLMATMLMAADLAQAQTEPELISIPLSRPGEPISLDVSILSARIEIIGEDRDDAEFEVSVAEGNRTIITPSGTKQLPAGGYALEVDEKDNAISVDTDWRATKVVLTARIPRRADLDISTVNYGEIIVRDIEGRLQLNNANGPITATGINGSVIAESINEDVDIAFTRIAGDDAMALSSINGDLTLAMPDDAGVQLQIDNARGEIYSDFEVEVQPSQPIIERTDNRSGVEVRVESVIVANVNGGGTVVRLKTLNGDIAVRRSGR